MDPKGTQLARKVVRGCQWCRRENVKMQTKFMVELPDERLTAGLYACPGYNADSFLATQTKFAAVYGESENCYADHGTQILAGAKRLGSITGTGARKTQWVFTATGCS